MTKHAIRRPVLVLLVALTALFGWGFAQNAITVGWYGGPIGQAFLDTVVTPFEQQTGIKVTVETAFDDARLTKLQAQPGSLDVAFFTDPVMPKVREAGIPSELSESQIPNLADVYPVLRTSDSVAWTFGVWGIAYNADEVTTPPTSWADLLDPAYDGHVTEPDITYNSSVLTLVALARLGGGSLDDLTPGFERMQQLRKLAPFFWASSSQMLQQLQAGTIWMTPYASGGTYQAAEAPGAPPIRFAIPKEGGYVVAFNGVIPSSSQHQEDAARFVNFMLEPAVQAAWAEAIYYSPGNRKTVIPADVQDKIVAGDQVDQLQAIDWEKFGQIRDAVVEKWQAEIH